MPASDNEAAGGRAWSMVALLSALYFVSFVDRVVLALLVQPLKADLGVDDVELGLLFGPAFAIFYALVGLPVARLADRGHRIRLVAAGAAIWGACTVASGFANGYLWLVLLRIGLAIGEATLTPAAYSLIGALFAPAQRIRAASLYSAVGVAGAAGAYMVGAAVIQAVGGPGAHARVVGLDFAAWQLVFVVVGLPPLAGAGLVLWLGREPQGDRDPDEAGLRRVAAHLRRHIGLYLPLFCGAGLLQAVNAGYGAWGPEMLRRDLGWDIRAAGLAYGLVGLAGAAGGVLLTPALARARQARGHTDAVVTTAVGVGLVGGAAAVIAPLIGSAAGFLALAGVAAFGLFGASTGLVVAMQVLSPQSTRATLVALLLLSITLLGQGLGPPAVALMAKLPAFGAETGLGRPLALVCGLAAAPGLLLLLSARKAAGDYLRERQAG